MIASCSAAHVPLLAGLALAWASSHGPALGLTGCAEVGSPFTPLTARLQLNAEMLSANARIDQRHNWESYWWEWPLNLRGILYYSYDLKDTYTATGTSAPKWGAHLVVSKGTPPKRGAHLVVSKDTPPPPAGCVMCFTVTPPPLARSTLLGLCVSTFAVYLLGNPAAIWLVFVAVIVGFAATFFYVRYRTDPELDLTGFGPVFARIGYCLIVYMLNLLPYILVSRSAFIYHYMPALMYAEVLTALLLEQLVGKALMPAATKVVAFIVVTGWLYYAPWVYALP